MSPGSLDSHGNTEKGVTPHKFRDTNLQSPFLDSLHWFSQLDSGLLLLGYHVLSHSDMLLLVEWTSPV